MAAARGSHTVVVDRDGQTLAGLALAISDVATICYLQDSLVHPEYHRAGLGREVRTFVKFG